MSAVPISGYMPMTLSNKRPKMKGLRRKVNFREEGRKESEIKTRKGQRKKTRQVETGSNIFARHGFCLVLLSLRH